MESVRIIDHILALDPAAKTGWSISYDGKIIKSGMVDFERKTLNSAGMKAINMYEFLCDLKDEYNFTDRLIVVFEEVYISHASAVKPLCHYQAAICLWCHLNYSEFEGYTATEISSHCGIKGRMKREDKKKAIIDWVKDNGHKPKDDNEADAIALGYLAIEKYKGIIKQSHGV